MADTYDIVGIAQRVKLMPGMGFEDVEDVTFKTKPDGLVGTVTLARSQATPDAVDKAVSAEVERLHAVKHL